MSEPGNLTAVEKAQLLHVRLNGGGTPYGMLEGLLNCDGLHEVHKKNLRQLLRSWDDLRDHIDALTAELEEARAVIKADNDFFALWVHKADALALELMYGAAAEARDRLAAAAAEQRGT